MRSRTAQWFETKIRYEKLMDDGLTKNVRETYVVEALSFTEAEARITEEMSAYISGEFQVVEEKIAPYRELVYSDDPNADKWYKAKVQYISIDEKTEREKRSNTYILVQADNFEEARKKVDEYHNDTMLDYVIASIIETQVMDVFEYKKNAHPTEEVSVTSDDIYRVIGCKLAKTVVRTWKEDFKDESTGEVVQIERNEIVLPRLSEIVDDNIIAIRDSGVKSITVYTDSIFYHSKDEK